MPCGWDSCSVTLVPGCESLGAGPAPPGGSITWPIPICAPPHLALSCWARHAGVGNWSHRWVRHMAVPEAHMLAGDPASFLASLGSHDWECPCRVSRPSIPLSADTRLLHQATISLHPKHTLHILHTHTHTFFFDLKQCHPCLGHFQRNLASSPRNSRNSLLGLTWEDLNTVFSYCCTTGVPFGHRVKYTLRGYMLSNQIGTLWASSGSQLRPPARPEWQHHQCGSQDPCLIKGGKG